MESAQAPLKIKINYTVLTKVLSIEWHNQPDGYFVHFEGSRESINFGIEPTQWSVGQKVKITFEGIEDESKAPA